MFATVNNILDLLNPTSPPPQSGILYLQIYQNQTLCRIKTQKKSKHVMHQFTHQFTHLHTLHHLKL